MKKIGILILLLIPATLFSQQMNIISFNIRYNTPGDGENAWPHRIEMVSGLLRFHEAGIFGLQEALHGQIMDIQNNLPGYEWLRERLLSEERKALLDAVPKLGAIAKELGASMAQLALAWTLKNPNVSTAITGASRPEQVIENMKAIDVLEKLDDSVMERIAEILSPLPEG